MLAAAATTLVMHATHYSLVLVTKQVVDSLYRVEGAQWNLYEDGVPVAHRTVPETRQLQCLQVLAVLTLARDEARARIHILRQVEWLTLVVLSSTNEIHRVEVSALGKHLHVLLVVGVNLRAFQNLQADSAIAIISKEWTTTWLTHVLDNAADTHRTVQLLAEIDDQVGILQFLDVSLATAEVTLNEADDFLQLLMVVQTRVEHLEIFERLLLKGHQDTCNHLLVGHGVSLQAIRHHIIDVLDEHHVGINLIEVLDKCAMTPRTEEQRAILIAEWSIVWVGSDGVGAWFLLREGDVVLHAKLLCIEVSLLSHLLLKESEMVVRDGEVNVGLAIAASIEGCLHQVLLHRSAHLVGRILMEEEQSLRQLQGCGSQSLGGEGIELRSVA